MRYHAVIGGLLIGIIGFIAIAVRSGPANTTAAPGTAGGKSSLPASFMLDPAGNFKQFSRDFVGQLRDLPAVNGNHPKIDWEVVKLNTTLSELKGSISEAELAYRDMSNKERLRETELPSLDGKRVVATPAEHLKNMRTTYKMYERMLENRKVSLTGWFMNKVHWEPTYEMDAHKTDSILVPYVGTITIQGTWPSNETRKRQTNRYTFTFAGQDGKWVLRSITAALSITQFYSGRQVWFEPHLIGTTGRDATYFNPLMTPAAHIP